MSVEQVAFDKKDQYQRIVPYILQGEILLAVYDCKGAGTGFVGFTDKRVIFYDANWNKSRVMISVPYSKVLAVACGDKGIFLKAGTLALVTAAGTFQFEFRGSDKAQWAYRLIMSKIL